MSEHNDHEEEDGDGWIPEPVNRESADVQEVTAERDPIAHPTETELKHVQFDEALDSPPEPGRVPYGFTLRQWQFCIEYLKDFNAAAAARRAGYADNHNATPYRLLKHPVIRRALEEEINRRSEMCMADHARIIQELCAIGYFDLGDVITWGGKDIAKLRESQELRPSIRRCLESVTETIGAKGDRKLNVKAHSKIAALTLLAQATGLVRDSRMSDRAIANANRSVAHELDELSTQVIDATISLCGEYIPDPERANEFVTALVERLDVVRKQYEEQLQGEVDVVVAKESRQLPGGKTD